MDAKDRSNNGAASGPGSRVRGVRAARAGPYVFLEPATCPSWIALTMERADPGVGAAKTGRTVDIETDKLSVSAAV